MTTSQPDHLDQIEATLETVVTSLKGLSDRVEVLSEKVEKNNSQLERNNDRVEIYQKASGQVVNLAFGLLATAAAAIIIPALLAH
jgi:uncharacterized protein YoxC